MNTKGVKTTDIIEYLSNKGVKINVTAIMTIDQAKDASLAINENTDAIISVFAGRIADTLIDPSQIIKDISRYYTSDYVNIELLWASTRELLNIKQAKDSWADIITVSPSILKKIDLIGKGLDLYSLETVKMFYNDAKEAGYTLNNE